MAAEQYAFSGKGMVVFVKDPDLVGDTFKMIGCQTSASIQSQVNISETATKCGTIKLPGVDNDTAQLSGALLKSNTDETIVDGIEFRNTYYNAKKSFDWKLAPQDITAASNGLPVYEFKGSISELTDEFPEDGPATFSTAIAITGAVTVTAYAAA